MNALRVDLLGTTQLSVGGQVLDQLGPKLRAVTAQLVLAEGRVVGVDHLLFGVWGEELPNTARNTLQYHVGVLRRTLGAVAADDAVATREPGYAINATSDVSEFLAGCARGDDAAAQNHHALAAEAYAQALNLWRGPALADLREFEFANVKAVALEAQRLAVIEAWVDAELVCGRADGVVRPLQELVTQHPTRERVWEQLMVALYRTGRQDAALAAYRAARVALDRELGVDPSARLVEVHQAILRQDTALDPEPALRPRPAPKVTKTVLATSEAIIVPPTLVGPEGQRVDLAAEPVIVGRHSECELVLADEQASRRHAHVVPAGSGYAVEDLGSTNGTRLNGEALDGLTALQDGDRIEIGYSVIRFVSRSARGSTEADPDIG